MLAISKGEYRLEKKPYRVSLPPSKSMANRALIIAALSDKLDAFLKKNPNLQKDSCRDTQLLLHALQNRQGVTFEFRDAGTPFRLFLAYACATFIHSFELHGDESLNNRCVKPLVDALRVCGAEITYLKKDGFPPLQITKGMDHFDSVSIDRSQSSQFVSAMLLVAPFFSGKKQITLLGDAHSDSYIQLTIDQMRLAGVEVEIQYPIEGRTSLIGPFFFPQSGKHSIPVLKNISCSSAYTSPLNCKIEGDWSAATFFYPIVYSALDLCFKEKNRKSQTANTLYLSPLHLESFQYDANMSEHSKHFGFSTTNASTKHQNRVKIYRPTHNRHTLINATDHAQPNHKLPYDHILNPLVFDMANEPDTVLALLSLCMLKEQTALFKNIDNLQWKESNRILAIQEIAINLQCSFIRNPICDEWLFDASTLVWPKEISIASHDDHRIVMAFSALSNRIPIVYIDNPNCVEKSFPSYWEQLKNCNFELIFTQ